MRGKQAALAVATAVALGVVLGGVVWAAGAPTDEAAPAPEPLETSGMSLVEIADAASAKPGEVIPPCPEAEVVEELKKADLDFGPCDPFPEPGEQLVMPKSPSPDAEASDPIRCLEVASDRGSVDLSYTLPCGKGLAVLSDDDFVKYEGEQCRQVIFIPETGKDPETEVFCDGEPMGLSTTVTAAAASTDEQAHDYDD